MDDKKELSADIQIIVDNIVRLGVIRDNGDIKQYCQLLSSELQKLLIMQRG